MADLGFTPKEDPMTNHATPIVLAGTLAMMLALPACAAETKPTDGEKKTKTERFIYIGDGEGLDMPLPPIPPMPPMPGRIMIDSEGGNRRVIVMNRGGNASLGPEMIYGSPGRSKPMTADDVKTWLGKMLERDGNPRLRLGAVKDKDSKTIEAVIETVDGSLVQKLNIDKEFGLARRVD